jgi:hypothetical protein
MLELLIPFASLAVILPYYLVTHHDKSFLPHESHDFVPESADDVRSPCPALNSLANHNYLPHDGRGINIIRVLMAIKRVYGLSFPLAAFIAFPGYALMREDVPTLHEFARHNRIEHDGSLSRANAAPGAEYAPVRVDHKLLDLVCKKIESRAALTTPSTIDDDEQTAFTTANKPSTPCPVLRTIDAGYIRHWRDSHSPPLDKVHSLVAQGELAVIIGIFSPHSRSPFPTTWSAVSFAIRFGLYSIGIDVLEHWLGQQINRGELFDDCGDGIPLPLLRTFFGEDRIPQGWKPHREVGLLETLYRASIIRRTCQRLSSGKEGY